MAAARLKDSAVLVAELGPAARADGPAFGVDERAAAVDDAGFKRREFHAAFGPEVGFGFGIGMTTLGAASRTLGSSRGGPAADLLAWLSGAPGSVGMGALL